jgi:hypothetical protein
MTPEAFTRQLPPVANDSLLIRPPYEFRGLSVRVFPLRANLDALQQLANDYLNCVPPEVGRFRAVVPYAYLAFLDYGQITEHVLPIGWFAQTEVFLSVPVEWYTVVNGRWTFHDWAVFTPYIFVNDDFSVPMGRMLYGFPKTLARVRDAGSRWLREPMAPVTVASIETDVFPEPHKGRRLESRVFLEVERSAPTSAFRIPGDPQSPNAPWTIASNLAQAMAGFGRDALWFAQSMRIFQPHPGADPAFIDAMLQRIAPAFAPGGTGFVLNSLNLKQFPRSEDPQRFCYQGLTNGRMQTMAVNGAGLLGEERTMLGDLSGGYSVLLHEYSSLPIARTLGLEVDRRWRGDGVDMAALKPVMPFWLDVNVMYQEGMNLAWRTRDGRWRGGNGELLDPSQPAASEADGPRMNTSVSSAVHAITGPFHFTGTTIRVLPLLAYRERLQAFLDTTINGALGDQAAYSDGSGETRVRLSVWARDPVTVSDGQRAVGGGYAYVYMAASSFDQVKSTSNNSGDWARHELSFLIPVKCERRTERGWEVAGVGLVPAFNFVDGTTAAAARAEVQGISTNRATFVRPESAWLGEGDAALTGRQTLLRVEAEVIPALGVGQKTAVHSVVEISEYDSDYGIGDAGARSIPGEWADALLLELETKKATKRKNDQDFRVSRALALELLGNRVPVSLYTLKQFRDVVDPGKACYQSLVRVSRIFDEVTDLREIERTIRVRIRDFPTLNLVTALGIWAKPLRDEGGGGVVYGTQAIRPFVIRANVHELLGERLLSRAGIPLWELNAEAFQSRLSDDRQQFVADVRAARAQDQGDPSEMRSTMAQAAERRRRRRNAGRRPAVAARPQDQVSGSLSASARQDAPAAPQVKAETPEESAQRQRITRTQAIEAVAAIDPQMVIEAILSREWGSFDEKARWRVGRRQLQRARDEMMSGGALPLAKFWLPNEVSTKADIEKALQWARDHLVNVEAALYESIRTDKAGRPGRPPMGTEVEDMIARMREFTARRLEMEHHFDFLAAWSVAPTAPAPVPRPGAENQYQDWSAADKLELVIAAAVGLAKAVESIRNNDVLGRPSKEDDAQVRGEWTRLNELLAEIQRVVGAEPTEPLRQVLKKGQSTQVDQFLRETIAGQRGLLIDKLREAVFLAGRYCDVQHAALINKLSRAYQKPDYCIRRDAVGPWCDELLPLTLSWDSEWYYGPTSSTDDDGGGPPAESDRNRR